jgi:hypothetical protein
MIDLDNNFATLLGRQPTDKERQNLYQIKESLNIKSNDAIWSIIIALEHYKTLYGQFPQAIENAANKILSNFKTTADATAKASVETAKADLAKAVAQTARDVAHNTSIKQKWQWACGCIATAFVCFGLLSWYMHSKAYDAGYARGYGVAIEQAQDEKVAASWVNSTPEGQAAYQLAKNGTLKALMTCTNDGWKTEKREKAIWCFPMSKDNLVSGWKLPDNFKNIKMVGEQYKSEPPIR